MRIKTIIRQHRRDFTAIYECEHCGREGEGDGYDDRHFHEEVIPAIKCAKCGKAADSNYRPLATKYSDGENV